MKIIAYAEVTSTSTSTINVRVAGLDTSWHEGIRYAHWYIKVGQRPTTSSFDDHQVQELDEGISAGDVVNFSGLNSNTTYYLMVVIKRPNNTVITTLYTSGVTNNSGGGDYPATNILSHTRSGTTITLRYRNPNSSAEYMMLDASDDGSNFSTIADCYPNDSPNDYGHPETRISINSGTHTCTVYTSDSGPRWFRFWRMYWDDDTQGDIYFVDQSIQNTFAWTSTERRALNNNGTFDTISAARFRELITAIRIMIESYGNLQELISYNIIKSENMLRNGTNSRTVDNLTRDCISLVVSGGSLRADVFNTLRYCVDTYLSNTYISTVYSGDKIYGSYFIDLVNAMDAVST